MNNSRTQKRRKFPHLLLRNNPRFANAVTARSECTEPGVGDVRYAGVGAFRASGVHAGSALGADAVPGGRTRDAGGTSRCKSHTSTRLTQLHLNILRRSAEGLLADPFPSPSQSTLSRPCTGGARHGYRRYAPRFVRAHALQDDEGWPGFGFRCRDRDEGASSDGAAGAERGG